MTQSKEPWNAREMRSMLRQPIPNWDKPYKFFYGETNNVWRIYLTPEGTNEKSLKNFILGGVVLRPGQSLANLASLKAKVKRISHTYSKLFEGVACIRQLGGAANRNTITGLLKSLISQASESHNSSQERESFESDVISNISSMYVRPLFTFIQADHTFDSETTIEKIIDERPLLDGTRVLNYRLFKFKK